MDEEAQAHPAADAGGQAGGREGATPVGGHQPDGDRGTGRALHRPTHFSTFSGVGGLDLGLERAGFRTLAFSEIEPYPSAVLATHWPDIPNLGDIVALAERYRRHAGDEHGADGARRGEPDEQPGGGRGLHHPDWFDADLWTGGFPCQDLSIAGRRKGMGLGHGGTAIEDTRSGLAFAFLDLLESALMAGRGPTYVLLENVPGIFSSHGGQDMAALLAAFVDLGYGICWRTLDARYSGVPQRRRRVFILGVRVQDDDPDGHLAAERAAEILALTASRCGHSAKGLSKGSRTPYASPGGAGEDSDYVHQAVSAKWYKGTAGPAGDEHHNLVVREAADPGGDGEADGPAGWLHHREGVEEQAYGLSENQRGEVNLTDYSRQVTTGGGKPGQGYPAVFSIVPEGGQGADLRASEVETSPSVTTEDAKQSDRGVRVAYIKKTRPHGPDGDEGVEEQAYGLSENQRGEVNLVTDMRGEEEAQTLRGFGHGWQGQQNDTNAVYIKKSRPRGPDGLDERWDTDEVSPTLNDFDNSDTRAVTLVAPTVNSNKGGGWRMDADQAESLVLGGEGGEDPLLPPGLDSNRYRACGNAVVVNVAEWIGRRLMLAVEGKI